MTFYLPPSPTTLIEPDSFKIAKKLERHDSRRALFLQLQRLCSNSNFLLLSFPALQNLISCHITKTVRIDTGLSSIAPLWPRILPAMTYFHKICRLAFLL